MNQYEQLEESFIQLEKDVFSIVKSLKIENSELRKQLSEAKNQLIVQEQMVKNPSY